MAKDTSSKVGNETKADIKGGFASSRGADVLGGRKDLAGAVKHLASEHPIKHDDRGPHQGSKENVTHVPLAGLRPTKSID